MYIVKDMYGAFQVCPILLCNSLYYWKQNIHNLFTFQHGLIGRQQ